tara:strand:+ start:81 stop:479 length:399 start_codon:yes stop_codon:yes gene_type:complete
MNSVGAYIVIALSTAVAGVLMRRLFRSQEVLLLKIALALILLVPILGPLFYLWLGNWPSRLPYRLNGEGGGLGRRHIEESASRSAKSPNIGVYASEAVAAQKEWEEARRQKMKSRKRRRLGKRDSSKAPNDG